jgi:hypothetical protein
MIESESQAYTAELYAEVLLVLDSREAVSNTRDRLRYFFLARGVELASSSPAGSSKIYLGDDLCS